MIMVAKLLKQKHANNRPDSRSPRLTRENPSRGPTAEEARGPSNSRPGPRLTLLNTHPGEQAAAESIAVDPQSMPLGERIHYYRSKIAKLAPAESFRDEVLLEVYGYLLTQSLRQQELG